MAVSTAVCYADDSHIHIIIIIMGGSVSALLTLGLMNSRIN